MKSFMGPLFALERVGPKCIDFATCFGVSRSVIKHQLTKEQRCIGLSIGLKWSI